VKVSKYSPVNPVPLATLVDVGVRVLVGVFVLARVGVRVMVGVGVGSPGKS